MALFRAAARLKYLPRRCCASWSASSEHVPVATDEHFMSKGWTSSSPPGSVDTAVIIPDHPEFVLTQEERDRFYPRIGNRDVVGFGIRGDAEYVDEPLFPCPAIRFQPNTPEFMALREKERGDWKHLTIEEKKKLYRFNFCRTYAEMHAPTGNWQSILSAVLAAIAISMLWETFVFKHVYHGFDDEKSWIYRDAYDPDIIADCLEKLVMLHSNPYSGVGAKYDYENQRFIKKKAWYTWF